MLVHRVTKRFDNTWQFSQVFKADEAPTSTMQENKGDNLIFADLLIFDCWSSLASYTLPYLNQRL